jgi:hypothetical protein
MEVHTMNLTEKIGQEIRVKLALSISDDAEAKKNGEAKRHNVTFIVPADWTLQEVFDRLFSASSPRVTFENKYRGKNDVPDTWTVNKAGARTQATFADLWAGLSAEEKAAFLASHK